MKPLKYKNVVEKNYLKLLALTGAVSATDAGIQKIFLRSWINTLIIKNVLASKEFVLAGKWTTKAGHEF